MEREMRMQAKSALTALLPCYLHPACYNVRAIHFQAVNRSLTLIPEPFPFSLPFMALLSFVSIINAAVAVASALPSLIGDWFVSLLNAIIACGSGRMLGLALGMLMLVEVEFVDVLARSGEKWMALNAGESNVGVGVAEWDPGRHAMNEGMLGSTGRCCSRAVLAVVSGDEFPELLEAIEGFLYSQSVVEAVAVLFGEISTSSSSLSPCNCLTHPSRYLTYSIPACNIASLCISTPSHAGIISLSTPNSSFILLRRLRSMMLCAVFLAIFRPAALVVEGCLRFVPVELAGGA